MYIYNVNTHIYIYIYIYVWGCLRNTAAIQLQKWVSAPCNVILLNPGSSGFDSNGSDDNPKFLFGITPRASNKPTRG